MKKKQRRRYRRFTLDFKVEAVARILGGESIRGVCRDLELHRSVVYQWLEQYRREGTKLLRGPGRPSGTGVELSELEKSARQIAELERKVGQQELLLDFFRRAFERVKELRQSSTEPGGTASTE